jgi:hypothetical protein
MSKKTSWHLDKNGWFYRKLKRGEAYEQAMAFRERHAALTGVDANLPYGIMAKSPVVCVAFDRFMKKKFYKEIPAKGSRGLLLLDMDNDPFFRIYSEDKKTFKDYFISNYDFDVKVMDKSAVFINGKLDISLGNKGRDAKPATGKTLRMYLLMSPDNPPFCRLYGPRPNAGKRRKWDDFTLTHPDLRVEITDKDAAFFESADGEGLLDYTSKSMSSGVCFRKGKCIWASEECKKYLSKEELQQVKEANLSEEEKLELSLRWE